MERFAYIKYGKKVLSNWWIYLSFIPAVMKTIEFYTKSIYPNFSINTPLNWQSTIYLFMGLFIVSGYLVWKKQYNELEQIKDKKPKLKLYFSNKKESIEIEILRIMKKVKKKKAVSDSANLVSNIIGINYLSNLINSSEESRECEDVNKSIYDLKFFLSNEGESPVEDIRMELSFPESFRILEKRPNDSSFNFFGGFTPVNRDFGGYLSGTKKAHLWVNKLHQTYIQGFNDIFILPTKEGEYKIKYNIISNDSGKEGIIGELNIKVKFKEESNEFESEKLIKEYNKKV